MFFPIAHTVELEGGTGFRWRFAGLVFAGLLLVAYWQQWIRSPFEWDLAIALTFLFGYRTFTKAFQDVLARNVTADQAVTIAALAALYVGEYLAAAEVVYIMLVGETLEEYAARKFHVDLNRLLSCLPHHASVLRDGVEQKVHLEELAAGEPVVIYPGQRIPIDGTILEGASLIDESSITGESLPRERAAGESVYAGTLNQTNRLLVEARQVGETTVLSRIVHLVRHAKENKAPIQRTADRYARWFLPLVLAIAAVCYLVSGNWMRSIAILIVACPCPMVLATPAAVLASISRLARRGIIVKGGVHLEKMARVNCIAFDKTGTLTLGRPELVEAIATGNFREADVLTWAASLETFSEHLLAQAIRSAAEKRRLEFSSLAAVERHPGLGMEGTLEDGRRVVVGSARFLQQHGLTLGDDAQQIFERVAGQGAIPVLVACEGLLAGVLVLRDAVRPEANQALHELRHVGVDKTVLVTGDNLNSAQQVARAVGITELHANLLPEEKLARLHELKHQGRSVAMVGDGVNDSPSLAAADVGIAMGDTGTDIAADASGVVLMGEGGLDRIAELIRTSRRTVKTIEDNIFWFGLVFNLAAVLAAFFGYLSAVGAALVHQGSSFLVLMNSLKLLREKPVAWLSHGLRDRIVGVGQRLGRRPRGAFLLRDVSLQLAGWARHYSGELARVLAVAIVAIYVLSGIAIVAPDQAGLVERFGRIVEVSLEPGIHYVFPWPIEKLHRVARGRIRALELGFRTEPGGAADEPAAYEWNMQHRQGRYVRQADEALMLTGDEYLVEVNAIVQYSVQDAKQYLFRARDLEQTLRAISEGALRYVAAAMTLDQTLALARAEVERLAADLIREDVERLALGIRIHSVSLQDVHPALQVVGAFRDVASAQEEKNRLINQAQAYANERVPLARGESQKRLAEAQTYRIGRVQRGSGEAERFNLQYDAYRLAPAPTRVRLYLENIEAALSGKTKYILDQKSGRRKVMLFRDSVFDFGRLEKAITKRD